MIPTDYRAISFDNTKSAIISQEMAKYLADKELGTFSINRTFLLNKDVSAGFYPVGVTCACCKEYGLLTVHHVVPKRYLRMVDWHIKGNFRDDAKYNTVLLCTHCHIAYEVKSHIIGTIWKQNLISRSAALTHLQNSWQASVDMMRKHFIYFAKPHTIPRDWIFSTCTREELMNSIEAVIPGRSADIFEEEVQYA